MLTYISEELGLPRRYSKYIYLIKNIRSKKSYKNNNLSYYRHELDDTVVSQDDIK